MDIPPLAVNGSPAPLQAVGLASFCAVTASGAHHLVRYAGRLRAKAAL
jgi:hypothetical protein